MIHTTTLHPSRIGCPSLPGTMKGIIASLPGVTEVSVRYDERSLDITFDDTVISPDTIIKKIGSELGLHMEEGVQNAVKEGGAAATCPM